MEYNNTKEFLDAGMLYYPWMVIGELITQEVNDIILAYVMTYQDEAGIWWATRVLLNDFVDDM